MIRSRVEFHRELKVFAANHGLKEVYFAPPSNVRMTYPCIVYEEVGLNVEHADNMQYFRYHEFELKIITTDGDSPLPYDLMDAFPYVASYSGRRFVADNLHHYVVNCRVVTKR